jgi:hypothetical protein
MVLNGVKFHEAPYIAAISPLTHNFVPQVSAGFRRSTHETRGLKVYKNVTSLWTNFPHFNGKNIPQSDRLKLIYKKERKTKKKKVDELGNSHQTIQTTCALLCLLYVPA